MNQDAHLNQPPTIEQIRDMVGSSWPSLNEQGIGPGRDSILSAAAIGLVEKAWRNSPVEDAHASRRGPDDGQMMAESLHLHTVARAELGRDASCSGLLAFERHVLDFERSWHGTARSVKDMLYGHLGEFRKHVKQQTNTLMWLADEGGSDGHAGIPLPLHALLRKKPLRDADLAQPRKCQHRPSISPSRPVLGWAIRPSRTKVACALQRIMERTRRISPRTAPTAGTRATPGSDRLRFAHVWRSDADRWVQGVGAKGANGFKAVGAAVNDASCGLFTGLCGAASERASLRCLSGRARIKILQPGLGSARLLAASATVLSPAWPSNSLRPSHPSPDRLEKWQPYIRAREPRYRAPSP